MEPHCGNCQSQECFTGWTNQNTVDKTLDIIKWYCIGLVTDIFHRGFFTALHSKSKQRFAVYSRTLGIMFSFWILAEFYIEVWTNSDIFANSTSFHAQLTNTNWYWLNLGEKASSASKKCLPQCSPQDKTRKITFSIG